MADLAVLPDDGEVIDPFPGLMTEEGHGVILPIGPELSDLAATAGDVSGWMTEQDLIALGSTVVEDYNKDLTDRQDWEDVAKESLEAASQEAKGEAKTYPWKGCANIKYPLLTTAALQFNARAYPAIVKGDEAVSVKVVGKDRGKPLIGPDGMPAAMGPDGSIIPGSMAQMAPPEVAQILQPAWMVPPGGKAARANRVADYLNTVLFYRVKDWEADTDALLMQLPIVGCVFRKVWWDAEAGEHCSAMVSALRIVVPEGARSCETTPRLTEEIPDVFPHEIREKVRSGFYREVTIPEDDHKAGARMLLEQHRLIDMDGDGLEEPYIVTVDKDTQQVLRIEPNYGPDSLKMGPDGEVRSIERGKFYVKYGFFPHPEGKFYDIGLGHLLKQVGGVINSALNQLLDAGTAQTAGGGFIASGVRLQARNSVLRFEPGEYKTVDGVSGPELRNAIVERTLPNVSPVTFQVLDLLLGAAKDITGVKDVITGEASNNGQVGTTLALIEQGLQVFNAVYKRIYRALKAEFTLIYENVSKYGVEATAADYAEVMDDPEADFERDFSMSDMDIRPVSDPSSVTRMQKLARAQALLQTAGMPGANPVAILKRVYEAMDVEDPDELMAPPAEPDPVAMAKAKKDEAGAMRDMAEAQKATVETEVIPLRLQLEEAKLQYEAFKEGLSLA